MAEENNGNVNIYGTIFAQQEDGKAAYANQIYDSTQGKFQGEINNDIVEFMNGTYTKEEVDALVETDTTPTEDSEKLITSGGVYNAYNELDAKIDESFQHQVYLSDDSSVTPIPSFDPQADTVHKTAQTLSNGEQKQVRQNIGLGNGDFATAQDFNNPTALQKKQVPTVGAIVDGVQHIIGNNAIKTNESQSLTNAQKAQAMSNMGVDEELALGAIYDVSAKNSGATFASLEALLNDANLNTLIPTSVRRGGMSIKFVLTSDNKYVQYRYMGTAITGNPNPFLDTANWQGVDDKPTTGSKNLVESGGVYDAILNVDVSKTYPTSGTSGTDKYTLQSAINRVSSTTILKRAGMTIRFIDEYDNFYKTYQFKGSDLDNFQNIAYWTLINNYGNFNYYIEHKERTQSYSDGLEYLFINPQYVSASDTISAKCYSDKLYIKFNNTNIINELAFSTIINNDPIDILKDNVKIGEICFKDKSKWTAYSYTGVDYLDINIITDYSRIPKILNGAVTTDKLMDGAVTPVKMSNDIPVSKIRITFFRSKNANVIEYEEGLKAFYLNPIYFDSNANIATKHYDGNFRIYLGNTMFFSKAFSEIENNTKVNVTKDVDGVLTIVGYVIFSDKSKWTAITDYTYPMLNNNIIFNSIFHQEIDGAPDAVLYTQQTLTEEQKRQARANIGVEDALPLELIIPNTLYAVVGTELNIWNDCVTLSVDKGLHSPLNYQVRWSCAKGLITDRCFRYTPADGDAGTTVPCACILYDFNFKEITRKQFNIKVLAKNALSSPKNIAFFGASLGRDTCYALYYNFANASKFTGTQPTMVGTRGTTFKYDAVGGYTWRDYATQGRNAYRIYVTNVTAVEVGSIYSLSGTNVEIREVNTSSGEGNILIEAEYGIAISNFPTSGTLTKVSGGGDDTISFDNTGHSDGGLQPNNPLWNSNTNSLDVALYRERCGMQSDQKIDAVIFSFGGNDHGLANNLDTLAGYINNLYAAFISDNPNCKFIIADVTTGGNDVNGAGFNYGATFDVFGVNKDIYIINKFYNTYLIDATRPNIRICTQALEIDRYYGYNFVNRAISQRYNTNEKVHNNYRHPGESGYGQLGDSCFAAYIGVLTE